jgi:threonine dehydratase
MSTTDVKYVMNIEAAAKKLRDVVLKTPLQYNHNLSLKYNAKIYLKREDQQIVRSYKLRGAYNMIVACLQNNCKKALYVQVRAIMRRALHIAAEN